MDLPAADDTAGLVEYADAVVRAAGDRSGIILVAQSMAGLHAPLACERLPVKLLVLLNAMTPMPGETGGDWGAHTGQAAAAAAAAVRDGRAPGFDPIGTFFHDVPRDVTAAALGQGEPRQSDRPFADPWPLAAWPTVPTRFLQGRDDRLFPLEFQRRIVAERLGVPIDEMPGGHLVALSRPVELADRLDAYLAELPTHPT